MPEFEVIVDWVMTGKMVVKAPDIITAMEYVEEKDNENNLPEGRCLEGSFRVNRKETLYYAKKDKRKTQMTL